MNKNKISPRENNSRQMSGEDVRRTDVKTCRTCLIAKPLDAFYNIKKNPDCKECRNKKDKEHYKNNSKKFIEKTKAFRQANPEKMKEQHLKKLYNLTLAEYTKKLAEQNGVCEICGKPENYSVRYNKQLDLAVDHDHTTGQIRGLLCTRCNITLGRVKENSEILSKMINYITKYQKLR